MKRRWKTSHLALVLLALSYVAAMVWVSTRGGDRPSDGRIKIRFAHWQIEKGPPDGFEAVIKRYEALNPHVDVEQVQVPGPVYLQWLRTNLVGGTATDIIEFGTFQPGMQDLPMRFFQPLTTELEQPNPYNAGTPLAGVPWRETFVDGLFNEQLNAPEIGQIYSVTMTQLAMRLFYNEDLLREITAGVSDFRRPENFNDLRQLFALTQAYAKRTGRPIHAIAGARLNTEWILDSMLGYALLRTSMALDEDGTMMRLARNVQIDYLRGRWSYRREDVRAALGLVRELTAQMRPGFIQLGRDAAVQEFLHGDALFVMSGTWDATSLSRLAKFPVGMQPVPQPDANDPVTGKYFFGHMADGNGLTAVSFYLNNRSPHPKEALDFLRFMTSIEGGQIFMEHSGWISSVRDTKIPDALVPALGVQDGYITGGSYMRTGSATTQAFVSNLYRLVGPQGSVDKFADALEQEMPAAQRADLETELRNQTNVLRPQDAEVMALGALGRLAPPTPADTRRRAALETNQTLSEVGIYQGVSVLAQTPAAP